MSSQRKYRFARLAAIECSRTGCRHHAACCAVTQVETRNAFHPQLGQYWRDGAGFFTVCYSYKRKVHRKRPGP